MIPQTDSPLISMFGDVCICDPQSVQYMHDFISCMDFQQHIQNYEARLLKEDGPPPPPPYTVQKGVAVMVLEGPVTKKPNSMMEYFGGFSTIQTRKMLSDMRKDPAIKSVMAKIESPGGTVSGIQELADDMFNMLADKPIITYYEDLGASGAVYIGSQSTASFSNAMGLVGSIGVYTVRYDTSEAYARAGVKPLVIKKGEFKGAMTPGTPITKDQVAETQHLIDAMYNSFVSALMRGRNFSQEKALSLATGRMWMGVEAEKVGLTDGVLAYEQLLAAMQDGYTDKKSLTAMSVSSPEWLSAASLEETTMSEKEKPTTEEISAWDKVTNWFTRSDSPKPVANELLQGTLGTIVQHPLVTAAAEKGIHTADEFNALVAKAEALESDFRGNAEALARAAYGDKADTYISVVTDKNVPFATVKNMVTSFEDKIASDQAPADRETAARGNAGNGVGSADVHDDDTPVTMGKAAVAEISKQRREAFAKNGK